MLVLAIAMSSAIHAPSQAPITLKPGMVIAKSEKVKPGVYKLSGGKDESQGVLTIKGKDITVDFSGATLEGSPQSTWPDERKGTAIVVQGSGITIKNVKVRGYKIGLIAKGVPGIRIVDSDFSYNWKQHLLSTIEREDESDWLSYHQNEKDEWLRYGAAIYLRGCPGFEVKGARAIGGQNGLMLTQCDKGRVWNCNFSFLSGCGLAMYRSSDNRIMHNKIDWCARGYSHGVYNRGQDSSGIIIYEQSNNNVFAYNSVTHGGDGFFLWAGQSTMDTGKGGCNDNILYGNDFSHAIANGIEATFSRNVFANNLMLECWHGIWAGFSWETQVIGNWFGINGEAIAWEHGQDNKIIGNVFDRDNAGIALWQNPSIDPNWGYGKARDCTSRDNQMSHNEFREIFGTIFRLRDTKNAHVDLNRIENANKVFDLSGNLPGFSFRGNAVYAPKQDLSAYKPNMDGTLWDDSRRYFKAITQYVDSNCTEIKRDMPRDQYLGLFKVPWGANKPTHIHKEVLSDIAPFLQATLSGGMNAFLSPGQLRGRRYILVDEWGPYDFKRPILWPRGETKEGLLPFEILGPNGIAHISNLQGVTLHSTSEDGAKWGSGGQMHQLRVPGYVRFALKPGGASDLKIELSYVGAQTVDVRGIVTPPGKPVHFGYSKFVAPIDWSVKWVEYDKNIQEPRSQYQSFQSLLRNGPYVKTLQTNKLDFAGDVAGVRGDYFGTLAEGSVELPPGNYVLNVVSDDGVRVWVDGKKVIDNWTWHGPTLDTAPISGGKHKIVVEHFEIDGYSMLKAGIQPRPK